MKLAFYFAIGWCVVCGFAGEAMAYDGQNLLAHCLSMAQLSNLTGNSNEDLFIIMPSGLCIGYVEGVRDTLRAGEKTYCLPEKVESKQAAQVVTEYLLSIIASPELKDTASSLVQRALMGEFPCTEGN